MTTAIYLCHPLGVGSDRPSNLKKAAAWGSWIIRTFGVPVIADWIWISQLWEETPANRELGLRIDCELVRIASEVWLVGGRVSPGMRIERNAADRAGLPIIDLTEFGEEPPIDTSKLTAEQFLFLRQLEARFGVMAA